MSAAVLLLGLDTIRELGAGLPSSATDVLALTGASRSQAYEMRARLRSALQSLQQQAGRPAAKPPAGDAVHEVTRAVLDFVIEHPGSVRARGKHRTYSDGFRRFVVELSAPGSPASRITHEQAAEALGVPLGTLKDWLRNPALDSPGLPATDPPASPATAPVRCTQPQVATLLTEYEFWDGNLSAFCEYARSDLALPFGRSFITHVLTAAELYSPAPRNKPHQAPWSRGSMRADFPGMQWFGDGKQLRLVFAGHNLLFNIEAMVDGSSNAVVAARVTDAEDSGAVIEAFGEGLHSTDGQPPLAVTLDNRPSNFSPQIDAALSCTELLRATPGRGQSKAPVEGAFGLFEQCLPGTLVIEGDTVRVAGKAIAQAVVHAFFAGRNGKPRGKLGGKSPAQAYKDASPTHEQVEQAKGWILKLRRREAIARQSRLQRADPVRLELLTGQLAALGIDDPQHEGALAISGYSLGAILHGIAVFRSKKELGTLPQDCDPYRYLAGIIRNTDTRDQLDRTAAHLLELRVRAGDLQRAPLVTQAQNTRTSAPADNATRAFVLAALQAPSTLEFRFWQSEARQSISTLPAAEAAALYATLARTIAASFKVKQERRERLIASLAEAVAPVAA